MQQLQNNALPLLLLIEHPQPGLLVVVRQLGDELALGLLLQQFLQGAAVVLQQLAGEGFVLPRGHHHLLPGRQPFQVLHRPTGNCTALAGGFKAVAQQAGLECFFAALLLGLGPAFIEVVHVHAGEQRVGRVGLWRFKRGGAEWADVHQLGEVIRVFRHGRFERRRTQGANVHQFSQIVEIAVCLFGHRRLDGFHFLVVGPPARDVQRLFIGLAQALETLGVIVRAAVFQQSRVGALDGPFVGIVCQLQHCPTVHVDFLQRQNPLSSCSSCRVSSLRASRMRRSSWVSSTCWNCAAQCPSCSRNSPRFSW